jgi:predicted amidophosphoribosyltransferase
MIPDECPDCNLDLSHLIAITICPECGKDFTDDENKKSL